MLDWGQGLGGDPLCRWECFHRHPCILPGLTPNLAGRLPTVGSWGAEGKGVILCSLWTLPWLGWAGSSRVLGIQQPSFLPLPATTLPPWAGVGSERASAMP